MISGTASRSIIGWSDRLFRPNHPVSRDDASMPEIPVLAMNSTTIRTQLVRILHLHYKTTCFPWKNEGSEATQTTLWTTHQGPRQRTRRRSTCRHGHAWIGRKAKAIGQKCKKPWENQGFLAERTGTELFDIFPMILNSSKAVIHCAKHRYFGHLTRSSILTDPDVVKQIQELLTNVSGRSN